MDVDGCGWMWMDVDGGGWMWMGVPEGVTVVEAALVGEQKGGKRGVKCDLYLSSSSDAFKRGSDTVQEGAIGHITKR
jgi:hypothetical protein